MAVLKLMPDTKSFATKNTGKRSYRSLSLGLVLPFKSTVIPVKVNCPSLGTQTPLPLIIYLEIYLPRADQATDV